MDNFAGDTHLPFFWYYYINMAFRKEIMHKDYLIRRQNKYVLIYKTNENTFKITLVWGPRK